MKQKELEAQQKNKSKWGIVNAPTRLASSGVSVAPSAQQNRFQSPSVSKWGSAPEGVNQTMTINNQRSFSTSSGSASTFEADSRSSQQISQFGQGVCSNDSTCSSVTEQSKVRCVWENAVNSSSRNETIGKPWKQGKVANESGQIVKTILKSIDSDSNEGKKISRKKITKSNLKSSSKESIQIDSKMLHGESTKKESQSSQFVKDKPNRVGRTRKLDIHKWEIWFIDLVFGISTLI